MTERHEGFLYQFRASLRKITLHAVDVMNESNGWLGVPIKDVEIVSAEPPWTAVQIPARATEPEHIARMLSAWQFAQPLGHFSRPVAEENYIVRHLLPIAGEVLPDHDGNATGPVWPANSGPAALHPFLQPHPGCRGSLSARRTP